MLLITPDVLSTVQVVSLDTIYSVQATAVNLAQLHAPPAIVTSLAPKPISHALDVSVI